MKYAVQKSFTKFWYRGPHPSKNGVKIISDYLFSSYNFLGQYFFTSENSNKAIFIAQKILEKFYRNIWKIAIIMVKSGVKLSKKKFLTNIFGTNKCGSIIYFSIRTT